MDTSVLGYSNEPKRNTSSEIVSIKSRLSFFRATVSSFFNHFERSSVQYDSDDTRHLEFIEILWTEKVLQKEVLQKRPHKRTEKKQKNTVLSVKRVVIKKDERKEQL